MIFFAVSVFQNGYLLTIIFSIKVKFLISFEINLFYFKIKKDTFVISRKKKKKKNLLYCENKTKFFKIIKKMQ